MTVMPRHIAYLPAKLSPEEQDELPWHRVVGNAGKLGKVKYNARGQSQAELLMLDGVVVSDQAISDFDHCFVPVEALAAGVDPGKHYST